VAEPRVVIVGAGSAGVRAAQALAAAGLRPIVIDEAEHAGGRIYQQPPRGAERDAASLYGFEARKAERIHHVLPSLGPRVDRRPGTLAWNCWQRELDLLGPGGAERIGFDGLILATGATELALPFPGWTLPGVFGLGAAQIALKTQGIAIGRRIVFLGAGPLLPLVAWQHLKAGAEIAAVLDATPFAAKLRALPRLARAPATLAKGAYYVAALRRAGIPMLHDVRRPRALGEERLAGLVVEVAGRAHRFACDALGASFGLRSETQLADLAGCEFAFDARTRQYLPVRDEAGRTSVARVYVAGDGAGIAGADAAELAGERAALAALEDLGRRFDINRARDLEGRLARLDGFRRGLEIAYPFPDHLLDALDDEVMVCRCEGVSAGMLRATATQKDAPEVNRLKALSRIGMGRCQGRMCGRAAAEVLARARAVDLAEVGRLRGQPPVKPIPMIPALMR
jgi:NADPH-dependent 2,4-dienoyl-CoA reductase/sulfur reductase-like enzyme